MNCKTLNQINNPFPLFCCKKNDKKHDEAVSIQKEEKKSKHMDIYDKKGFGYKR